jgi:hypothetical protein
MRLDLALLAKAGVQQPVMLTAAKQAAQVRFTHHALTTYDLGPEPLEIPVGWPPLPGTDAIEIAPATMTISPLGSGDGFAGFPLGELPSRIVSGQLVVDVPAGRRVRGLHIEHLTTEAAPKVPLRDTSSLGNRRLTVSPRDPATGGFAAPVAAVPALPARGQTPRSLTGADYTNRVLHLPDIATTRLRISLVDGDTPDSFSAVSVRAGKVTGWAAPTPRDLTITGPDGVTLWSFPGDLLPGSPPTTIDLTVGLQGALEAMRRAADTPAGTLTVTAAHPCRIRAALPTVKGAMVREVRGVTKVTLDGVPAPVPVDGASLPHAVPTSAVADVHITYAGLRLAEISDPLPASEDATGIVVRDEPRSRVLPPQALRGERVARVGLIGRAVGATDLTVQLVDATPGSASAPLGEPAVVAAAPAASELAVTWAVLPEPVEIDRPTAVTVTATRGAFLWVADPEPRLLVTVVDPDPGERPILLGARTLLTLPEPELVVQRASLPGAPFGAGGDLLVFASPLYCTVALTDVVLRYERSSKGR